MSQGNERLKSSLDDVEFIITEHYSHSENKDINGYRLSEVIEIELEFDDIVHINDMIYTDNVGNVDNELYRTYWYMVDILELEYIVDIRAVMLKLYNRGKLFRNLSVHYNCLDIDSYTHDMRIKLDIYVRD